jgi:hypothetical protein
MLPFKILSIEILVLLAALALMVYIQKQQVSKIYSYLSSAIFILVLVLMGSTIIALCKHRPEQSGMHPMHGEPHIKKEIIIKDAAELEEEFEMNEGEMPCDKPCCAADKEGEQQIIRKEIILKNSDSLAQKRIIIRRK